MKWREYLHADAVTYGFTTINRCCFFLICLKTLTMLPKILLVDDSPFMAYVVTALLCDRYDVEVAYNTAQMLEKFTHQQFALALMDLELQDGVRVTRLLPTIKERCGKVIVFSQTTEQRDFDACVSAAVDGFIAKSSQIEHLSRAVEQVIAGHQSFPPIRLMAYGKQGGNRMPVLADSQYAVLDYLLAHPHATNAEIAKATRRSSGRVANILTGLYKLLGVEVREQLPAAAQARGYEAL